MADANARLADRSWLERRYRHDGVTVAEIAEEAEADLATVWRALARHKIPLRGPSGRRSLAGISDRAVKAAAKKSETLTDAARALDVDLRTLTERLARMGLHAWPGGPDDEMAAEYRSGASLAAIAASRQVSTRTVRRRLAAAGVEMRRPGHP